MSIATITYRLDDRLQAEGWSIERSEANLRCFNCLGVIVGGDYSIHSPRNHDYHDHCAVHGSALIPYDEDNQPSQPIERRRQGEDRQPDISGDARHQEEASHVTAPSKPGHRERRGIDSPAGVVGTRQTGRPAASPSTDQNARTPVR